MPHSAMTTERIGIIGMGYAGLPWLFLVRLPGHRV